jgi:hypothetical protein
MLLGRGILQRCAWAAAGSEGALHPSAVVFVDEVFLYLMLNKNGRRRELILSYRPLSV